MSRGNLFIEVASGILLVFMLHVLAAILSFQLPILFSILASPLGLELAWLAYVGLVFIWGIGFFQLLYVVPAYRYYRRQRRFSAIKGLIIGAVLTALLNGGCFLALSPIFNPP